MQEDRSGALSRCSARVAQAATTSVSPLPDSTAPDGMPTRAAPGWGLKVPAAYAYQVSATAEAVHLPRRS